MQNYLISGLAPKKVSIFLSLSSYENSGFLYLKGHGVARAEPDVGWL